MTEADKAPTLDAPIQNELLDRRFNEFRMKYLDDKANYINWWLSGIAIVFALVVALGGALGYLQLQEIKAEARRLVEEIKDHKKTAEKDTQSIKDLREITSKSVDNPATDEQARQAVEAIQRSLDASLIDRAIADAYLLQKTGEKGKAIEKWRSIANLMEGSDKAVASRAWFSVGYLLPKGSEEEAISAYDQAIRLNLAYAVAYFNRGVARTNLEQYEEAIKDYGRAILLDPNDHEAYNNRGAAKTNLEQYEEAIKDYDQAIKLDPNYALAYFNRGETKAEQDNLDVARIDLKTALSLAQNAGMEDLVTAIQKKIQEIEEKIKKEKIQEIDSPGAE